MVWGVTFISVIYQSDEEPTIDLTNLAVEIECHWSFIAEIKPLHEADDREGTCQNMMLQTLVQARHAFELEGPRKQIVHVWCIVGGYFFMYWVERTSLDCLPYHEDEELVGEALVYLQKLRKRVMVEKMKFMQNDDRTDYSDAFKGAWNKLVDQCGLDISVPQWSVA